MSRIEETRTPLACSARIAASRPGAGAADEDLDLAHAMLHGLRGRPLGGELRRVGRALGASRGSRRCRREPQAITLPLGSVIVIKVLLNVERM